MLYLDGEREKHSDNKHAIFQKIAPSTNNENSLQRSIMDKLCST